MPKTVDYYLSIGCDQQTAEYFAAGRRKIVGVVPNDDFTLTLTFDSGERRIYNVAPLIQKGGVFKAFADIRAFRRVYLDEQDAVSWDIDPNVDSSVVWNNKVDLCPDDCYIDSVPLELK